MTCCTCCPCMWCIAVGVATAAFRLAHVLHRLAWSSLQHESLMRLPCSCRCCDERSPWVSGSESSACATFPAPSGGEAVVQLALGRCTSRGAGVVLHRCEGVRHD
eukprot:6089183-Amphidinium_carterae.1